MGGLLKPSGEKADLTIIVGGNKKPMRVHKDIVCNKSTFFKTMCSSRFIEATTNEVQLPEHDRRIIAHDMRYIYTGDYKAATAEDHIEVFTAAIYLGVDGLNIHAIRKARKVRVMTMKKPDKAKLAAQQVGFLDAIYSGSTFADRDFPDFVGFMEPVTRNIAALLENEDFAAALLKHEALRSELGKNLQNDLDSKGGKTFLKGAYKKRAPARAKKRRRLNTSPS